jgi:hypothetical protein
MRRLEWQKTRIDDGTYEAAGVFDVNNDGVLDIVCGGYWYEGPEFAKKHRICDIRAEGEYWDDFSVIPLDVNGDGYMDFITGGYWGRTLVWRENPQGGEVEWKTHEIDVCGKIETTRAWDVDGDGEIEIVPNTPAEPVMFFKLLREATGRPTGQFRKVVVGREKSGHGLGFGDITGNGRGDLVTRHGWYEAPDDPLGSRWTYHPEFDLGKASIPIIVADLNRDGLAELIVGQAHGYGLDYYRQELQADGSRRWTRHPIDPYMSQYHDMQWVDLDGDGACELITGNRYRAHNGREPGETEIVGLYCFKWNGESFTKQVIDHGLAGQSSGTGIFFSIADLDGNDRLDIVAPGKEGLFLFRNLGPESAGD